MRVLAYISRPENYNVILLDWGELCTFPWYRTAAQNVKLVGQILKNFIELYNESGEIPIQKLHVIGFSLGSHIASMAGKGLQGQTRIPRITALDPAYPEFSLKGKGLNDLFIVFIINLKNYLKLFFTKKPQKQIFTFFIWIIIIVGCVLGNITNPKIYFWSYKYWDFFIISIACLTIYLNMKN